jgi:adenosylcobinamide-phosphate synthase
MSLCITSVATSLCTLALALLVDTIFGEPPERVHLTVWIGKTIEVSKRRLTTKNAMLNRINGILLALSLVTMFAAIAHLATAATGIYLGHPAQIITSAVLLKMTFAIRSMRDHALPVAVALRRGDPIGARVLLQHIVRRNTSKLNEQQTISAAVESVAEGTVDGIASPIFYYAIFGVLGAVTFRVINTLDSVVGYKDPEHVDIGWFSAKLDTFANYLPARFTALAMILAAFISNQDWRKAWRILMRDKGKTESLNAGWPMSAMAGLLNVQLEKPGAYVLGDRDRLLSNEDVLSALHIMKTTVVAFLTLVVVPMILIVPLIT